MVLQALFLSIPLEGDGMKYTPGQIDELFAEFRAVYPRRKGRQSYNPGSKALLHGA